MVVGTRLSSSRRAGGCGSGAGVGPDGRASYPAMEHLPGLRSLAESSLL